MLSGYNINIISRTKLQEKVQSAAENLRQLPELSDAYAQVLVQNGIMNLGDLVSSEAEEISQVLHVAVDSAQAIIDAANKAIESGDVEVAAKEDEELISASAVPAYSGLLDKQDGKSGDEASGEKFSEAEQRLREELAAFKLK